MNVERVIQTIDSVAFAAIRERHPASSGHSEPKYLDLPRWIGANLKRVRSLGLDQPSPRRVFDIGCGAGYFLHICELFGHHAEGCDLTARPELFRELTALLGVSVTDVDIAPFVALPIVGTFDVVTAHMICFNGHETASLWGPAEWAFFLDDLATHVAWGGVICLELNREPTGLCYTPAIERLFLDRGAEITGAWPHRPQPGGRRVVFRR